MNISTRPLVSIIIPAFNAQNLIAETLDSILKQAYVNLEVIVVDDGSTDGTFDIVSGYGTRVRYFYQENSGGCAVPRNTGVEHSSGDFLCFMDADDLMVPDRLARQIDFMERHPYVGLVFCDYQNFNEDGPYPKSHFQSCPRLWSQLRDQKELVLENPRALLAQENFGIAGSFLIRKKVLNFEVCFEPTLKACEDFHFYFRLARHTRVGLINEVGMMRRIHGNNMSGNPVKMLSEGVRSRILLCESEQDSTVRSYLNKSVSDCQGSLARFYADNGRYLDALQQDLQALVSDLCWKRLLSCSINIFRTLVIAMGLHIPKINRS